MNSRGLLDKNNRFSKIMFCIFMYIILSTDTLLIATNSNKIYLRISQYILVISTIILFLIRVLKKRKLNRNIIQLIMIYCTFLFGMIINQDFTGGYILKIFLMTFSFFFVDEIDGDKFIYYYIKVMKFIAIFSLITFIFTPLIRQMNFLPVITNLEGSKYKALLFSNIPLDKYVINRNYGPFWEPGVYQAYLCFGIIMILFNNITSKYKNEIIIFIITIISTLSTTGIICVIIILFAYLLKAKDKKFLNKFMIGILVIVILGLIISNDYINNALFDKFSKESAGLASFASRWYSIFSNINIFFNNMFFGVGPSNINNYTLQYKSQIGYNGVISQTNTILMNFSMFGIFYGIYYIIYLFRFIKRFIKNFYSLILIFCVFCILLFMEPLTYSLLFNMIIFLNFKNKFI